MFYVYGSFSLLKEKTGPDTQKELTTSSFPKKVLQASCWPDVNVVIHRRRSKPHGLLGPPPGSFLFVCAFCCFVVCCCLFFFLFFNYIFLFVVLFVCFVVVVVLRYLFYVLGLGFSCFCLCFLFCCFLFFLKAYCFPWGFYFSSKQHYTSVEVSAQLYEK